MFLRFRLSLVTLYRSRFLCEIRGRTLVLLMWLEDLIFLLLSRAWNNDVEIWYFGFWAWCRLHVWQTCPVIIHVPAQPFMLIPIEKVYVGIERTSLWVYRGELSGSSPTPGRTTLVATVTLEIPPAHRPAAALPNCTLSVKPSCPRLMNSPTALPSPAHEQESHRSMTKISALNGPLTFV